MSNLIVFGESGYLEDTQGNRRLMGQALFNGQPIIIDENYRPWMSQGDIAEMFGLSQPNISAQLKRLEKKGVLKEGTYMEIIYVAKDGKRRPVTFYSLKIINVLASRADDYLERTLEFIDWAGDVLEQRVSNDYQAQLAELQNQVESLEETVKGEQKETREADWWAFRNKQEAHVIAAQLRHDQPIDNWMD